MISKWLEKSLTSRSRIDRMLLVLALSVLSLVLLIVFTPARSTLLAILKNDFVLQPRTLGTDWVVNHGRFGNILAAPFVYIAELVTQPWLESSKMFVYVYSALLLVLFAYVGTHIYITARRNVPRLFSLISLTVVAIVLPAVSGMGVLRLYYVLPLGVAFVAFGVDDLPSLRMPLMLAASLAIVGNGFSLHQFVQASTFSIYNFEYFNLTTTSLYVIGQTSIILLVASLFGLLAPRRRSL